MPRGRAANPDVNHLRVSIASFGFTVVTRLNRIFVIYPGSEKVYICKKLARQGFWELNEVNRNLWELYGALGISIFPYISVQELIKWFYELALDTPEIMEGLQLRASDYGNLSKHAETIKERELPLHIKREKAKAKKKRRNKRLREAQAYDKKRQDSLRDRIDQPVERPKRRS